MVDNIEFEQVLCNLCGSDEGEFFLAREDLYAFLPGTFRLVRCRNCGLIYQNPRPTRQGFDLIYPSEYGPYIQKPEVVKFLSRVESNYGLQKRVNLVMQFKKEGILCDLGCATGDFLEHMAKQTGWQVVGIEPNEQASKYARSQGLNVLTGTIDQVSLPEGSFDVITMWHVIEHLYDPVATLNAIYKFLKPNGILIFVTPSVSSLEARIFGRYWSGFELPRHFFAFSPLTIQKLLTSTGYKIINTRFFYGSHAAFMSSLRFLLRAKNGARRTRIEDIFFSLPFRILMSPFFYLLDRLKLSSPMTVICQKDLGKSSSR